MINQGMRELERVSQVDNFKKILRIVGINPLMRRILCFFHVRTIREKYFRIHSNKGIPRTAKVTGQTLFAAAKKDDVDFEPELLGGGLYCLKKSHF